jgi:GH24 family phage-related lysozyme (muramidase)
MRDSRLISKAFSSPQNNIKQESNVRGMAAAMEAGAKRQFSSDNPNNINEKVFRSIIKSEGFKNKVYNDKTGREVAKGTTISADSKLPDGGFATVGYGTLAGDRYIPGISYSKEELTREARKKIFDSINEVNTFYGEHLKKAPISVLTALVDVEYNLGSLSKTPNFRDRMNEALANNNSNQMYESAKELLDAISTGGLVSSGLVNRRAERFNEIARELNMPKIVSSNLISGDSNTIVKYNLEGDSGTLSYDINKQLLPTEKKYTEYLN